MKVALLSKWHVHATDYEREAKENPLISIEKVWDEEPERGQAWADELGVPFEQDLDTLLDSPDIDAVIVSTPTNLHTEVIHKAAEKGKHIFTEKVLALTTKECESLFKEIEKTDVKFMISLPRLTRDYYLYAQQVVDNGMLGTVTMMRCRVAHNGSVPSETHPTGWLPETFYNKEQCGGGALIDLGAHPIYLANRLMGKPLSVSSRLPQVRDLGVDDNAVAMLDYDSGALAILETSFVSAGSPFQLELYGTKGTLMIEDDQIRIRQGNKEWKSPEDVPENLPMPMEQWAQSVEDNASTTITKQDALLLTAVNEAASLSDKEGRRVSLNEL